MTPRFRILALSVLIPVGGCHVMGSRTASAPQEVVFVSAPSSEAAWERIVSVLHNYPFEIARENKLDGIVETKYKTGATLLEPWHRDTVGLKNRLEAGIQSVRRKVFVTMTPSDGGYVLTVRADKEISNSYQPLPNTAGGATFLDNTPLRRDLTAVVQERPPNAGWVARGRDAALEQNLLSRLQAAFQQ